MTENADRVVTPMESPEERAFDASLRPKTLNEYIGQPAMREKTGDLPGGRAPAQGPPWTTC